MDKPFRDLEAPVSQLKGIGPARETILAELGIRTLKDLLLLIPRRFHQRGVPGPLQDLNEGKVGTAAGTVAAVRVTGRGRRKNLRVTVQEGEDRVELFLFNRGYLKSRFKKGSRVVFQGKVTRNKDLLQLLSPDYHLEDDPGHGFPGLVPAYSLPPGLFPRTFHRLVDEILVRVSEDTVPDWQEAGQDLMSLAQALRAIHRPGSLEEAEAARRRIAFEEFFAFQLGLARDRSKGGAGSEPLASPREAYEQCLPFTLTQAQESAVAALEKDLSRSAPMHRLLQGDVGSGKTVVALFPLLAAALAGGQGAFMAPTEVLAEQHHQVLCGLLEPLGLAPTLLRAGMPTSAIKTLLEDPGTRIVVGTHSLVQARVAFRDLRACVIDEQHKFGVRQRWNLKAKGREPHVLVMTATPIPRSLALTLYGELDVTVLDSLPPGRKPVATFTAPSLEDPELGRWLEREIAGEGQAFFVCPLVEESEKLDLQAAVTLAGRLEERFRGRCSVGLLHGRLKGPEKVRVLDAFRAGRLRFLVTTVVVEVGVDIPEASTVVILDAWRFGLAQLHQIRGRVGRGQRESRCYLVGEPTTDAGIERVRIISETSNGFRIAEEDLKMRGPGEALGLRQHGLPTLRAGDYLGDLDLMTRARDEARRLVAEGRAPDPAALLFGLAPSQKPWIG